MTPRAAKKHRRAWKLALERLRSGRSLAARTPTISGVTVWLPGGVRECSIHNANEFLAHLEEFLKDEGLTVVRPSEEHFGPSLATKCGVVVGMTLSVGTSAEAVDIAHNIPPATSISVFMPIEFHNGYVRKALERLQVQLKFFDFHDIAEFRSTLPLQIVGAIEAHVSRQAQEARLEARDRRCSVPAAILFVDVPHIRDHETVRYAPDALAALQNVIREAVADQDAEVHVLSALCGAIVVIPDGHVDVPRLIDGITSRVILVGVPVRIGVTHGDVERVPDIDNRFNFVGPAINAAARIAVAADNPGVLVDASYAQHALEHLSGVSLGPAKRVYGKRSEVFDCIEYPATVLTDLDATTLARDDRAEVIDAVFIAFDLPRFSEGDRWQLARRATEVAAEVWRSLTGDLTDFYFSPGGDGGVIVVPAGEASGRLTREAVYGKAVAFYARLVREGRTFKPEADVTCRVGVHYGQVRLYTFGQVVRPAGAHLFAADILANDAEARKVAGVVVSAAIADALNGGSATDRVVELIEMAPVTTPAGDIRRFVGVTP